MQYDIQIYSPKGSNALNYVLDFVFNSFYGCKYEWIDHPKDWNGKAALINYSNEAIENSIHIQPNNYLFNSNLLEAPIVEAFDWETLPVFFKTTGDTPFDIFSAIFYLLARVEEYANPNQDMHDRFNAAHSVFDVDFIQRPVIDEWLYKFRKDFLKDTSILFSERRFQWINTYDIDVAYAYRFRSAARVMAAAGRNLLLGDFKSFFTRFQVLLGNTPDPYDTYEFQKEIAEEYSDESIYFFLLADMSKYDRNLAHNNSGMVDLIKWVQSFAHVGIHPSYASSENPKLISTEKNRLFEITGSPVIQSRQHFLKFKLPETFRYLIGAGIEEDYSMGYADMPGFRSGTCTPHYFFDVESNQKSEFKIFPLIVMDASLREYLKLKGDDGLKLIKLLIDRVRAVDGVFVSLWHNDTLSDSPENEWREVYRQSAIHLKSE